MAELSNPFPDFAVVTLRDDRGAGSEKLTVGTDQIFESRELVRQYLQRFNGSSRTTDKAAFIIRVQGDYGSGKTHLLLDALTQVEGSRGNNTHIGEMRLTCSEADPVAWYQAVVAPQLRQEFVRSAVTGLYAKAGAVVAGEAKLTEAAVGDLSQDPSLIYALIRKDLLNATAVQQGFVSLLRGSCRYATDNVARALGGIVWTETVDASLDWLSGERLGQDEQQRLRLPERISAEDDAMGAIAALAAIHSILRLPFVVLFDELEHFVRFDESHGNKRNLTWLKRLLESLGAYSSLVYVAGHWSAWELGDDNDFAQRFNYTIRMLKLTSDDVTKIVGARIGNLSPSVFGSDQATLIARLGRGNIRGILTLCRALFNKSSGFSRPLTSEEIQSTAASLLQRVTAEEASDRIADILETKRLKVARAAKVGLIPFDLIGYLGSDPRVCVSVKHAVYQQEMNEEARRFREQMRSVVQKWPEAIGCFLVDGNVDDKLLSILRSTTDLPILWFDLDAQGVFEKLSIGLDVQLGITKNAPAGVAALVDSVDKLQKEIVEARDSQNTALTRQLEEQRRIAEAQIAQLRAQFAARNEELEKQLQDLEGQRSGELRDLQTRLDSLAAKLDTQRDSNLVGLSQEEQSRLDKTYEQLMRPVSFLGKLRMCGLLPIALILLSPLGAFLSMLLMDLAGIMRYYNPASFFLSLCALLAVPGVLLVWRRVTHVEQYLASSARLLRELFITGANPRELVKADNILRRNLEERGPSADRRDAEKMLAREFPEVFSYLEPNLSQNLPASSTFKSDSGS